MAEENKQARRSHFREHMKAAARAYKLQWRSLLPENFWRYRAEARREFLLAMRGLVETAIERIEGAGSGLEPPAGAGKQKIEVEVE
ncbi:MAG: hypothetical protein WBH90_14995 [Aggregatilineales bacterium]|nr:hypothetical protein [Chloroflexota bacterium]HOA22819.1 hypothetical protein [Aggregatilineales bacterium]HPV05908.1 hypothetical protein [Aggregatilineales bacterium]HQE19112.1 hypothetical protein [Aggregatilineales bacterium]